MRAKIHELEQTKELPSNGGFLMPVWNDIGVLRSITFKQLIDAIEELVKSGKRIKMVQREDQSIIFEELK